MRVTTAVYATFLGLFMLLAPWQAQAGAKQLVLDPAASELTFLLDTPLHEVHGTLRLSRGTIVFNPDTGAVSGEIVVDAQATDTDNKRRDKKMHGQVLESGKYPEFVFRPSRIDDGLALHGRSEIRMEGTLSLHGSDHAMTLPAVVEIEGDQVHAQVGFPIPYVEWGLEDPSVFILRVSKQVEVTLNLVGRLSEPGN